MANERVVDCPAAAFGRELVRAIVEVRRIGDRPERLQEMRDHQLLDFVDDRIGTLEREVAQAEAQSIEGALYQVLVFAGAAERVKEDHLADRDSVSARRLFRRMHGCLFSVIEVLTEQTGADVQVAAEWYLSPNMNPHPTYQAVREGVEVAA